MTDALPSDYDKEDGYNPDNGLEHCPLCEQQFGGQGGHLGEVYDQNGRRFEHFMNTDSTKGPFFCPDCWPELERNQKQSENKSLGEFA